MSFPIVPRAVLARESARLGVAFLAYLALHPLWMRGGLHAAYRELVLGVAGFFVTRLQHFPVLASLSGLEIHNLDFAIVLLVALTAVQPWGRIRQTLPRAAALGLVLFGVHVLAVAVQASLAAADDLQARALLLHLPWETWILERVRYLAYDFGVQLLPFALLLLSFAGNARAAPQGRPRVRAHPAHRPPAPPAGRSVAAGPRPGRRQPAGPVGSEPAAGARGPGEPPLARRAALAAFVLLPATLFGLSRVREADPRHVAAHAGIGHTLMTAGRSAEAERQYRKAVAGATRDPEVFFRLATLVRGRGDLAEALDLLERGAEVTADPVWQQRFRQALAGRRSPR